MLNSKEIKIDIGPTVYRIDFGEAAVIGSPDESDVPYHTFSFDVPHTEFQHGVEDEELGRLRLQDNEALLIERMEMPVKGVEDPDIDDFSLELYDIEEDSRIKEIEAGGSWKGDVERPYYSPEEANQVWRTARKMGKQELALVSVNLGMGLRNIEAWRLKWKHIDLKERVMEITGKNKERENVIPKRVNENLREWKEEQTERFGKCDYVFVKEVVRNKGAEPGDHVKRPDTLTDWLNKILDKADVETRDGFRAGRRRFGRDLYKATGFEIRSVSQYFGHSDPRETLKYLQLDEFDQREKIDQLDEMLENLHYPERKKEMVETPVKMKAGPEEEKRAVSVQPNQPL